MHRAIGSGGRMPLFETTAHCFCSLTRQPRARTWTQKYSRSLQVVIIHVDIPLRHEAEIDVHLLTPQAVTLAEEFQRPLLSRQIHAYLDHLARLGVRLDLEE